MCLLQPIVAKAPKIRLVLAWFILCSGVSAIHAQPLLSRDALIDRHALAAPKDAERSLDTLAAYLAQPAQTERDKARAIFRWMVDRLRFDVNAHFTGHPGELHPETVLREREATAFGYANLFESLARRAGLEAVTIHGHAKMKHYTEEGQLMKVKHAWNAVRVDGSWVFLDVLWASGFIKGQRFHRIYQEQYFLISPQQMILTHLPTDPRCQLLSVPMSPAQFDALPVTNAKFFNFGLKSEASRQVMTTPEGRRSTGSLGTDFYLQTGKVKVLTAPAPGSTLARGGGYYFVLEAPDVTQMALWNNGYWVPLHRNGTRFEGGIRPEMGEMRLCLQRPLDPNFQTVLTYKVGER